MSHSPSWFCEHCEAEFAVEDDGKVRCPTCLRSTGLTHLDASSGPPRRVPARVFIGVGALALAVGALVWFFAQPSGDPKDGQPEGPAPGVTEVVPSEPSGRAEPAPEPRDPPAPEPAEASSVLVSLARRLTGGAQSPERQQRQLLDALHERLKPLPHTRPLGREVLSPAALAERMIAAEDGTAVEKAALLVTGIESGAFTLALLGALGVEASPVVLFEEHAGRTSLRRRMLAARVTIAGKSRVLEPLRSREPFESDAQAAGPSAAAALLDGLRALRLLEQARADAADELVRKAIARLPTDASLRFLKGQITMVRGESAGGLLEIQKALAAEGAEDSHGRYELAVALLTDEQTFKAFGELRRSVELDPKNVLAWGALGQLTLERIQSTPEEQRPALSEELDAIIEAMTKIGKDAPGLIELRVQRLRLLGKTKEARSLAVEALTLYPERAPLHVQMAEMALQEQNAAVAERHLERAMESDPYDADPALRLMNLYAQQGESEKAVGALRTASERAPYDAGLLAQLGNVYVEMGKLPEAEKVAEALRNRFPKLSTGWLLLGQVRLGQGRGDEALPVLNEGLEQHPRATELYTLLYVLHTANKRLPEAQKVLDRLLKVDPDGRLKLAEPMLASGLWEVGAALLEAELKDKPERIQVAVTLAQLYKSNGEEEEVQKLRKHVGKHVVEGDREGALKAFDEAVAEIQKQIEAEKAAAEKPGPEAAPTAPEPDPEEPPSTAPKASPAQ